MGKPPPAMRYRNKRGTSPLSTRGRVPRVLGKDCQRAGITPTPATTSPQGNMPDRRGDAPSASSTNAGRVPALVEKVQPDEDEGKECQDDQAQEKHEPDAAHHPAHRLVCCLHLV